jgi:DNA mismatch endonuclease (patch repair protein)
MTDRLSRAHRSWNMSRIRGSNTAPERRVQALLRQLGLRFRLHDRDLPGSPDIVLPRRRIAIFVHGCFWHRHPGCRFAYNPHTRRAFWREKFAENVRRDQRGRRALNRLGWSVLTVWECRAGNQEALQRFLAGRLLRS